jgi:O-antigen ligase
MRVVTGSVSCRAARRGWHWIGTVARCSLVGRFILALARVLGPVFADSLTFGTRHTAMRRLTRDGHPASVLAISRPYLWLRTTLGGGAVGRAARAAETEMMRSHFAGGAWVRVVGTGLFALGCGRLVLLLARGTTTADDSGIAAATPGLRLIAPLIVLIVGVLVFVAGPRVLPAFRGSLLCRGLVLVTGWSPPSAGMGAGRDVVLRVVTGTGIGARREERPSGWVVVAGTVLAGVAGAAAGLTSGSSVLVVAAVAVSICLFAVLVLRPEVMLLVVAAFPWLDWVARRGLGGIGPGWDEALLLFSVILLLWSVSILRRGELWTVPITLPALLALAAAVGSVVIQDVPGDVALFALRVTFQPLLFYFLGFLFPKDRRWVQATVAVFIIASVAMALHGLYQYVTDAPMPTRWVDVRETDISTRAYSIIQNPNGLGAFLLIGALVSLSLALAPGLPRIRRGWLGVACVAQLGGVVVTFSRGAWIGLAAGLVALLILAYRRYLAPLVAVGVVAWFVMPQAFINRLTFAFSSIYITKSLAFGRLYVWKMSLQHVAAHPWFGLGLGTFGGTSAVTFGYGRLWVDNFYLQLAAEGGLLLLGFFLWVLLRGAKGLVKGYETTHDPYLRALCAGTFGALVAVSVANVTASVWETLVVGVGFWFLAGLATSAALEGVSREADV